MELTALPITLYFQFAGVILIIFLAMAGWGGITARLLQLEPQFDVGMLSALGMAVSAVLGGILSLMGVVGPIMANLYLAAGIGAMALGLVNRRRRLSHAWVNLAAYLKKNPFVLLLAIVAAGLLLITILQSGLRLFNPHDDFHAYLVFPSKMIQTGSFGADPFSERRMNVLGGYCFLQALVLGVLNLRYVNILGMGIGWLVFISLIAGHGIKRNLSAPIWLSLVIILHFIHLPLLNTSSAVTGAALFFALMRAFFLTKPISQFQRILLLGLLTAGLCSLKNSHIAGAGMLVLLVYLLSEKSFSIAHWREFLLVVIVTGICLFPWMLETMMSSGTFLFPLFGKGYHGSAYGSFPSNSVGELSLIWFYDSIRYIAISKSFILGLLLTVVILRNKGLMPFQRRLNLAIFIGTWITAFLMVLMSGLARYAFPVTFSCIFWLIMEFLALPCVDQKPASRRRFGGIRIGVLILVFILFSWPSGISQPLSRFTKLFHPQRQWAPGDVVQYRQVQNSIPAGTPVLARVSKPFLFNFQRNEVFTVDWPGGASPPPGLPLMQDAEKIADYLLTKSIRYVIYSYGDEAGYSYSEYKDRLTLQYAYLTRVRDLTIYTFMFHKRLMDMNRYFKKIYDDGNICVFDLVQRIDR